MYKNIFLGMITLPAIVFYISCRTSKISNHMEMQHAQEDSGHFAFYKGDSVAYINYFYKNQSKYIGKPLSTLLKDMDFKIYQFSYNGPNKKDGKIYSISLNVNSYYFQRKIDKKKNNIDIEIGIGWQTFVPMDSIIAITRENGPPNYFNWSKKAEAYFSKQIVGNIWLYDYMKR